MKSALQPARRCGARPEQKQHAGVAQQQSADRCRESPGPRSAVTSPPPRSTFPERLMAVAHISGTWWELIDQDGRKLGVISYPFSADPDATEAVARRLVRAWNAMRDSGELIRDIAAERI